MLTPTKTVTYNYWIPQWVRKKWESLVPTLTPHLTIEIGVDLCTAGEFEDNKQRNEWMRECIGHILVVSVVLLCGIPAWYIVPFELVYLIKFLPHVKSQCNHSDLENDLQDATMVKSEEFNSLSNK